MREDSLEDFLDVFEGRKSKAVRPPAIEHDDSLEACYLEVVSEPELPSVEDENACLQALFENYPDAHEGTLRRLVSAGALHVSAALRSMPKRTKQTLRILLRERGSANSDQFVHENGAPMRGNNANISDLRREGFILHEGKIQTEHGHRRSLFTLDFKAFDPLACRRSQLSKKQRQALLERDQHQCQVCGSRSDLEEDHRVGLVLGGTEQDSIDAWQILCRGCNRNKRIACAQCPFRDPQKCLGPEHRCFWSSPDDHSHKAGEQGLFVMLALNEGAREAALTAGLSPRTWALQRCSV